MSFRDSFFGDSLHSSGPLQISYGENVLINTTDRGFTNISKQMKDTNWYLRSVQSALVESQEHYRELTEESAQLLAAEIGWQTDQIMQGIDGLSKDVRESSSNITSAIGNLGNYLGAELSEVRWAIERNTSVTQQILDVQLKSHWNDSRQYFEEGVQCYDGFEREFAMERFQEAVRVCKTNAFAYQYLGFLAVHRNDGTQAVRNFELAAKFAPSGYHQAIARYHLSRALHASGDEQGSLEHIKTAVALERENLVYLSELVRSLVRVGAEVSA